MCRAAHLNMLKTFRRNITISRKNIIFRRKTIFRRNTDIPYKPELKKHTQVWLQHKTALKKRNPTENVSSMKSVTNESKDISCSLVLAQKPNSMPWEVLPTRRWKDDRMIGRRKTQSAHEHTTKQPHAEPGEGAQLSQGFHRDFTGVSQGFHRGFTEVSQGFHRDFTKVSQSRVRQ